MPRRINPEVSLGLLLELMLVALLLLPKRSAPAVCSGSAATIIVSDRLQSFEDCIGG